MNKNVEKNTKLSETYKNLTGVKQPVEDMDLPVSVYNYLKRGGIDHLEQLLLLDEAELMNIVGARRNFPYLISWLEEQTSRRQCTESTGEILRQKSQKKGDNI